MHIKRSIMGRFERFLLGILQSRKKKALVILVTILFLMGSVAMIPTKLVLAKMLPGKSANTFTIYIDAPTGSSIHETKAVAECVVKRLQQEPEITDMEVFLGQGAPLDYAGLVKGSAYKRFQHQAEIVVNLTDRHFRDEPSFMMVHRLRPIILEECKDIKPGTSIRFIEMPSGPPTLATIVVEVYGKDEKKIRKLSQRVKEILEKTDGLVDVDAMIDEIYPTFLLVPDKDKILKSGLGIDQVNQIIYLAFKGMPVAVKNTRNQQDQIPIFLRLDESSRKIYGESKAALERKLSSLRSIMRKNLRTMGIVTAECDMVSQVYPLLEARATILEELSDEYNVSKVPGISTYMFDLIAKEKQSGEELLIRWDGEMKVSLDTFRDLGGAFIAALILMFLLMVVYYKSFALSGIVLIGSFLSIIGVILGHWLTDKLWLALYDINFFLTATSLIGFISLMGISARGSLLLIDFSRSLMKEGMEKKQAIARATATRAKPILMTAVAIILGSLLLSTDPIFGGLGIALIFGSMAATAVALLFIPVLIDNTKATEPREDDEDERELFEDDGKVSKFCVLGDNIRKWIKRRSKEDKSLDFSKHENTHESKDEQ